MWIYYYAMFGPGHQSREDGFKYFSNNYSIGDIEESLLNLVHDHYDNNVVLDFWEVERPSTKYVENKVKNVKEKIKNLRKYLKTLESTYCFCPEEKKETDPILQKNISNCVISDLLKRLHNANFMYDSDDINNWRYGKKCLTEPIRSKILRIMRKTKKYPSIKKQLRKVK